MPLALREVTPPTGLPLELADIRGHLGEASTEHDERIKSMVAQAVHDIEVSTNRQMQAATWRLFLDCWPATGEEILIPRAPLRQVNSIKYVDTSGVQQTLAPATYVVDTDTEPGRVYLAHQESWPTHRAQRKAIEIEFQCGYVTVPEGLLHAVRMATQELYDGGLETGERAALDRILMKFTVPELV